MHLEDGAYVQTDGGTAGTIARMSIVGIPAEISCTIGLFMNMEPIRIQTDQELDLTNPSMSLTARQITVDNPRSYKSYIWAHASYWGAHVNPIGSEQMFSDSTVFQKSIETID